MEHLAGTKLQAAPERNDEFEDAQFPLGTFAEVSTLPAWSRISLECFVKCPGDLTDRRLDVTGAPQYVRDVDICDSKGTWLQLRIVHPKLSDLNFLEVGLHIIIKYGKTTGRGIYGDITELTQVEATGKAMMSPPPDLTQVEPTGKAMMVHLPEPDAAQPLVSQQTSTQTDNDA